MRQLFWPFSITYRKFCVVAFVTPYKVHQIPFQKTFEQTKSTRRVLLFASAFSVPLLRPPRNLLVKNEWYIGATVTTRWSSAFRRLRAGRTGEGAPSVSRPLLRYIVSPSRKNNLLSRKLSVRFFFFLHAALTRNSKDTILFLFPEKMLCVDFQGEMGGKNGKNHVFF